MKKLNIVDRVVFVLLIIGGLNLGVVGVFHIDMIDRIFSAVPGELSMLVRVIFTLIGISALYAIYFAFCCKGKCSGNGN